jgi:hypothetical protein
MRTHAFWLWIGPLGAVGSLALVQCSGSDSAGVKPDSGGSSGTGTSSGASASGSGGGSAVGSGVTSGSSASGSGVDDSGGGPNDGAGASGASSGSSSGSSGSGDGGSSSGSAAMCMSVDGGAQCSDPGMVPCGSTSCTTSMTYCCVVNQGDAGPQETCVPPNGSCASTAARISCNEAADCTGSNVCCASFPMLGVQGVTSCMASCSAQQNVQICRSDAECGTNDAGVARKCVLQTCGSLTLQLCTAPFSPADAGGAYQGCTAK